MRKLCKVGWVDAPMHCYHKGKCCGFNIQTNRTIIPHAPSQMEAAMKTTVLGFAVWIADWLRLGRCEWVVRFETNNRNSDQCFDEDHWEINCKRHRLWFTGHITLEKADHIVDVMNRKGVRCRDNPLYYKWPDYREWSGES